MLFEGQTIKVDTHDGGIAELRFERGNEAVNKLDKLTFDELRRALDVIKATPAIKGVLITSAKDTFIVGADIFEFTRIFRQPEQDIIAFVAGNSDIITALDDLPVPTVAAINGLALGGGFEVALAADYRVMSNAAKIGFPEISLGLFPGYGGTVRLPRLAGLAASAEWIISGAQQSPDKAVLAGAVDAVAAPDILRFAALAMLERAITGEADWQARRARMKQSLGVGQGRGGHSPCPCQGASRQSAPASAGGAFRGGLAGASLGSRPRRRLGARSRDLRQGREDTSGRTRSLRFSSTSKP